MLASKPLVVSQLNLLTKKILEGNFPSVLVEGEISNLVEPASGHLYFSLKDDRAQVRAVFFHRHRSALKFKLRNGLQVVVTATVSLYEARGDYQLLVEHLEAAGEGILYDKFLQLKERLLKLGYFDSKYKKELPRLPHTIGVITSKSGAVIRDILTVLRRRFPGVKVIIYPTLVQGDDAAPQVAAALATANLRGECQLLIIARGGGSMEDLWAFNEEIVAQAIFNSDIPVISAIGHETDFTIADFVADLRAPTPSAAAEMAVPSVTDGQQNLDRLLQRLAVAMERKLEGAKVILERVRRELLHPKEQLMAGKQMVLTLEHRLHLAIKHSLSLGREYLARYVTALNAVSPLATLARGYGIVMQRSKVIATVRDLAVGDIIHTKLSDGEVISLIKEIK